MRLTTPKILSRCPMFAKLSDSDHERIAAVANVKNYKRNDLIFSSGDTASRFFVVLDGDVKVFKSSPQGKEQILHVMRPFNTFAEAAVFIGGGFPASAMAMHETKLLEIPRDKFVELMRSDPELSLRMMASLSVWLHRLVDLVEDLSLSEVPTRLARRLIRIALESEVKFESGAVIHLPISKTDLARLLGTVGETLSRVLSRMSAEGIVSVKGRDITILDARRIEKIAEGETKGDV